MKDIGLVTDLYRSELSRFEREPAGTMPAWVQQLRQAAGARFADLGFPTTHHEEWRHTDVTPIVENPFSCAKRRPDITKAELEPAVSWAGPRHQLTFVNGHFSPLLSVLERLPQGVIAGSLADSCTISSNFLEPHLGRHANYEDQAFVALNTAFLNDGAFVYLPPNTMVEEPIFVVFVSCPNGEAAISHPRVLIVAGPSSRATVIESYLGLKDGLYFTNVVTEVVLGEEAVFDHHLLQQESRAAYHIATLAVHQGRNSTFTSHSLALGGALARTEVHGLLADEGSTCTLRGLYGATGRQHVGIHTRIDHAKPRCTSRQLYKGILSGHASGVFHGRILVRQDAHETDARQTNNNLLLSEDAVVHTTPQLEIFADDVKCSHGATVGQLDRDVLFYLRSRGLDLEDARRLMTQAFGSELIRFIAHDRIRNRFTELLPRWTSQTYSESFPA
ncbi:MAG: Fe-S cluster assembly protein SufD [Nitrospira sp.]|nr:Fe-S cluster assembly protein SufD [Nitrospira sp.]